MEQLILHLFGDYITQTDWMAKNKVNNILIALLHAFIYSIPFLLLEPSLIAFLTIFISHALIDRYRLARHVIFIKNLINEPHLKWVDCSITGYHKDKPQWLTVWLLIITDNTMHIIINYCSLKWL